VDFAEGGEVKPGRWYQSPSSVPFLFIRTDWGHDGGYTTVRGILVNRDGIVQEAVRSASQARRMREIAPPGGEAYREAERRYEELRG
jgi:hypothetical protein